MRKKGLYGKYQVFKADGSEVNSFKFVLSPEKDAAALLALEVYAIVTDNDLLRKDLERVVKEIKERKGSVEK